MKLLKEKQFSYSGEIINFVTENNIKQKDIQQICVNGNFVHLYYWREYK